MHWTYAKFEATSDLEQGDLLSPTGELVGVLREVHPHFVDEKYLAFAVTTQSCDLVRRGKYPKASYVNIATVRSLKVVLPKILEKTVTSIGPGFFRTSSRSECRELLQRLFDQNEQALGLFYLHPDADLGIGESAVVFLRVSVALRAEHYGVLVNARCGRLDPEFRSKFGWLVGNLYSRPASPDWSEKQGKQGTKEKSALVERFMEEQLPGRGPVWLDDATVDAAIQAGFRIEAEGNDRAMLLSELKRFQPRPRFDDVVDEVKSVLAKLMQRNASSFEQIADALVRARALLAEPDSNDPMAEILRDLSATVGAAKSEQATLADSLGKRLINSARLRKLIPK